MTSSNIKPDPGTLLNRLQDLSTAAKDKTRPQHFEQDKNGNLYLAVTSKNSLRRTITAIVVNVAELFGNKGLRTKLSYHDQKRAKRASDCFQQMISSIKNEDALAKITSPEKSPEISLANFKDLQKQVDDKGLFPMINLNSAKAISYSIQYPNGDSEGFFKNELGIDLTTSSIGTLEHNFGLISNMAILHAASDNKILSLDELKAKVKVFQPLLQEIMTNKHLAEEVLDLAKINTRILEDYISPRPHSFDGKSHCLSCAIKLNDALKSKKELSAFLKEAGPEVRQALIEALGQNSYKSIMAKSEEYPNSDINFLDKLNKEFIVGFPPSSMEKDLAAAKLLSSYEETYNHKHQNVEHELTPEHLKQADPTNFIDQMIAIMKCIGGSSEQSMQVLEALASNLNDDNIFDPYQPTQASYDRVAIALMQESHY